MEYTTLGNTSIRISRIALGTMSIHPGSAEASSIIDMSIEKGINFFDTADLYDRGENETMIGNLLKAKRKELVIATKVGNQWDADGKGWSWNPRKEYILKAVDESLRRLQTDYIDLYQLHGGTIEDPIDETIEAFEWLKSAGKIRDYGISYIRPNVIRRWLSSSNLSSVMMQYSLLDTRPEEECLKLLQSQDVSVLARGALAQGLLVNKPAKEYLDHTANFVASAAAAVKSISTSARNEAQTAIGFVLSNRAVSAAIVGARTTNQLNEALSGSIPNITEKEAGLLHSAVPTIRYTQHR